MPGGNDLLHNRPNNPFMSTFSPTIRSTSLMGTRSCYAVALADGDGVVGERLVVHGDRMACRYHSVQSCSNKRRKSTFEFTIR